MTVLAARSQTPESAAAVAEALKEAQRRSEDLAVFDFDGDPPEGFEPVEIDGVTVRYYGHDLRNPDAVGDFLDTSVELAASVIVVGVKHRSAVGKLLLGSNAQTIILDAQIPVLSVKVPH